MKKIILAITALLTTMIIIAQPLMVHAEFDYPYTELTDLESGSLPTNIQNRLKGLSAFNNESQVQDDYYFIYFVLGRRFVDQSNTKQKYSEFFLGFDSADVEINGSEVHISNMPHRYCKAYTYYTNSSASGSDGSGTMPVSDFVFNFSDYTYTFTSSSGENVAFGSMGTGEQEYFCCPIVISNIDEIQERQPVLDLDVTFTPSMSGTVRRTGSTNGAEVTYNYLNLNIKNYGDNAQWLFCIVPQGQSLSFPEAIINTPQGFLGNPTFVWVTDEWIDWTNGLTGITGNYGGIDMQMLYAPCAWHTLITGSDRTYRINWDMMKLTKDVSYDCVVYGMINEEPVNASDSGTGLGCWTVKSALSGITEVYRSTFTMPNPPEFNPDSIDEGNSAHAWNPDIDNSSLFNHGSVYKDANGNLVIKGTGGITNGTEWELGHHSGSSLNTSSAFGGFFGLIKGIFGGLPSEFYIIITFGLVAIVAVGIIKAVK